MSKSRPTASMGRLPHDTRTPDVETASAAYARRFAGNVGEWFLSVQDEGVRRLLERDGFGPGKVLEIGGGHGQVTETFLAMGHQVTVHGSSSACFERQKERRGRYSERLRFVVSSLRDLPCPDRSFDLVVAVRLLAHVEDWRAVLDEMVRVARRFVLVDFAPLSSANLLTPALFWAKRGLEGSTRPYFCYWERTVRSHLRGRGFGRFSTYRQFSVPMGIHRALNRVSLSRITEQVCRSLGITRWVGSPALLIAERGERNEDREG